MKDLLKKPVTFEKIEFWAATAIYVVCVFILLGKMTNENDFPLQTDYNYLFEQYNVPYSFTKFYFIPQLCRYTIFYGSFIVLNFFILKAIVNGKMVIGNLILVLLISLSVAALLGITDTWMKSYLFANHGEKYVYHFVFKQEAVFVLWVLIILGAYMLAKRLLNLLFSNVHMNFLGNKQLTLECIVAVAFWLLIVLFFAMSDTNWKLGLSWCEVLLFEIVLYWYLSYKIAPNAVAAQLEFRDYLLRVTGILLISVAPVAIIMYVVFRRLNATFYLNALNVGVGLFVVAPLAWFLYQYRLTKNTELQGLKTALGSSNANLDFLRSQINPHFLFNALNTLYGTALQENAGRTGEGIQKLGDMMRFMLQENVQEKISLAREIDYLSNYIDLQKLRTQTSPDILIQTEIDDEVSGLEIAPMLLIPFVENAFKHGISLREPSHIKIALQTRNKELLFDVYNSIHLKAGNDPEKNKSGIGLENVKQRLLLLYPKRHELVVRESAKEFFIHLTVQL